MILSDKIEIKISRKTITHFRKIGYEIKLNDIIYVNPNQLPKGSHIKIRVKCEICGNEKEIMYQKYIKNINNGGIYACSSKCAQFKVKKTSLENFGTDYYTQTDEYIEKIKQTSLEKYNVNHHTQSQIVKDKAIKTNLKIYGFDNPSKSDIIKEKIKNTFIERYGVENISQLDSIKEKLSINSNDFKKYGINILKYSNNNYDIKCSICNKIYSIHKKTLRNRLIPNHIPCINCNPLKNNVSFDEKHLLNFIKENYNNEIIINDRQNIKPFELDIYLPDLKLAFEFNGVYWHNELNKTDDYHFIKTELCEKQNIQLIHIYEDDWIYKQDVIKSMILNKLGKSLNKIYARKTEVREITDNKLVREFLNKNHIQGFVGSKIKIGLFYKNELVSLMTFGKTRKPLGQTSNENDWEMLRFCNKLNTNIIGGASKLFKYFIKNYDFEEIITYADKSHSNGKLYEILGFIYLHTSKPNYYYVIDDIRHHRFNFRKDILIKEGYDANKTEHQIMLERKIYRIYNSGNLKYIFKN